jgi:hypothetical protein
MGMDAKSIACREGRDYNPIGEGIIGGPSPISYKQQPTQSTQFFGEQANPLMTTEQLEFVASHPNDEFTATGQYIRKASEFGHMFPNSGPNAYKNPGYSWGTKTYFDPPPLPYDPLRSIQQDEANRLAKLTQMPNVRPLPNRGPVTDDEILAEADKINQLKKGVRTAIARPYENEILRKAAAIREKRNPRRVDPMPRKPPPFKPNISTIKGIIGKLIEPKNKVSGSGRSSGRAAIVKNVMSEMGMGLIDASRYVKANNLY